MSSTQTPDRLALDAAFFDLNFAPGDLPPTDGVIAEIFGVAGGAAEFIADETGFSMSPSAAGEAPVFSLTADGVQLLSFDPLDIEVEVAAGDWALLVTATVGGQGIVREAILTAGRQLVGFGSAEVEGATAISFALHALGEGQDHADVRFLSVAAEDLEWAEGHEPDEEDAHDPEAGLGEDPEGDPETDGAEDPTGHDGEEGPEHDPGEDDAFDDDAFDDDGPEEDGPEEDGIDDEAFEDDGSEDGFDDDAGPQVLSFGATAGEGPLGAGVVTLEIVFDWAVSGVDAGNFAIFTDDDAPAPVALLGAPVSFDGGFTWAAELEAPAGEYEVEVEFVIDAGLSAVAPTGETISGPAEPEAVAETELRIDGVGPELRAAFVQDDRLHLAFDEALGEIDPTAFTVTVGEEVLSILAVDTPHRGVAVFTLSRAVGAEEAATLSHAGGGATDALGNGAEAFDATSLRNFAYRDDENEEDDADEAEGEFEIDEDGAVVGHFDVAGGGPGPVRLSGGAGALRLTPPGHVSVSATVATPVADADARGAAAAGLIDLAAGFSGRGARRVETEAREGANGREMAVMRLAPTASGEGEGRFELEVERDPGVLTMVGLDAAGLGADARLAVADADLLQLTGRAEVELLRVATAVMDRGAQRVTVAAELETGPVALFAGGGWDEVTLSGLTGRTRVDLGAGRDVILSTGYSADEVFGGLGDDEMRSGGGRDMIRAGAGDDRGWGEGGADRMFGGGGQDALYGGAGEDRIRGGVDDDMLSGGEDDDVLFGGSGDDVAAGDEGDDRIFGGQGDDDLSGGDGDDMLDGQSGADVMSGGAGDDDLRGGAGDDDLSGDAGEDDLRGGDGVDRLTGGADDDDLRGGDGADVFVFAAGSGGDRIRDFEVGIDRIETATLADFAAVEAAMTETEEGVLLDLGGGDRVFLDGIAAADLDEGSFLFV